MPDTAPDLIAAARDAGIGVPLLSGDGWDADTVVAMSKEKSLGDIYFTTHNFFVAAYGDRFGGTPPNAFAPLGCDTVNLLADAIRRAGSADPAAVRTALAATENFPGVVGAITYEAGVRVPKKEVSVIEVENGSETLRWVAPPQ